MAWGRVLEHVLVFSLSSEMPWYCQDPRQQYPYVQVRTVQTSSTIVIRARIPLSLANATACAVRDSKVHYIFVRSADHR